MWLGVAMGGYRWLCVAMGGYTWLWVAMYGYMSQWVAKGDNRSFSLGGTMYGNV